MGTSRGACESGERSTCGRGACCCTAQLLCKLFLLDFLQRDLAVLPAQLHQDGGVPAALGRRGGGLLWRGPRSGTPGKGLAGFHHNTTNPHQVAEASLALPPFQPQVVGFVPTGWLYEMKKQTFSGGVDDFGILDDGFG